MATKKRKGNGHSKATKRTVEPPHIPDFKEVIEKTAMALGIVQRDDETPVEFRRRRAAVLQERWTMSGATWTASKLSTPRRRPTHRANPQFFADAQQFGAAKFRPDGTVIRASLNRGPDKYTMLESMVPGSDKRAAERRDKMAARP